MVNAVKIREMYPHLRTLAAQQRFYMQSWASGFVNPHAAEWQECTAQFCFAGATALANGYKPHYETAKVLNPATNRWKNMIVASGRFFTGNGDEIRSAEHLASDELDLTFDQRRFLFYGTHITRVDDLIARCELVIAEPDSEHYLTATRLRAEYAHGLEDADEWEKLNNINLRTVYTDTYDREQDPRTYEQQYAQIMERDIAKLEAEGHL